MPSLAWKLYTLEDAYKTRPALDFLIHGIFAEGSVNIVYGAPGSLKSLLLADAMVAVATGEDWLPGLMGGAGRSTMQSPCLWCDFDNGERRTHERFDALGTARHADANIDLFYVAMPVPWLDMTKTGMIVELIDMILLRKCRFVVFDNLGVISGRADENSVEMVQVMANLRLVAERTGAAVVVIHHQRKESSNGSSKIRSGDSLRGHSCIEAAIDLALLVKRETGSSLITVTATKSRGVDVQQFGATFSYTHRLGTNELQEARFYGEEIADLTSNRAIEAAILTTLTDQGPLKQTDLVGAVRPLLNVGINRIRSQIAAMLSSRTIVHTVNSKNSHVYSIP